MERRRVRRESKSTRTVRAVICVMWDAGSASVARLDANGEYDSMQTFILPSDVLPSNAGQGDVLSILVRRVK
jgi:hypothetical protein